jgi:hypothetical protein
MALVYALQQALGLQSSNRATNWPYLKNLRRREETTSTFVILADASIQDATRPIRLARVVFYTTLPDRAHGIPDSRVRGNDIET